VSPKPRSRANVRLPRNLSTNSKRGAIYFRYWHPVEKRYVPFGTDRAAAIAAAIQVNEQLLGSSLLADRALSFAGPVVRDACARFKVEFLATRQLAPKTFAEYGRMLERIERELGADAVARLTVERGARFLAAQPIVASHRHRNVLVQLLRFCRAKGWIDHNPADATLVKVEVKERRRLTLEDYRAIWRHASTPMQNAMDLSLQTLQARLEVATMRWADIVNGVLNVRRQKTNAYLAIEIAPELEDVVRRCRDDVVSPYLVHQAIGANKRRRAKALSPESISRGFARARDASKRFEGVAPGERPTFHEIRSLGADLYRKAGKDPQQLLAHAERAMTEHYLEGHEPVAVRVRAGLKL
jgi:hypothetical protein